MSFTPSYIAYENMRPIRGTPWSYIRHRKNCLIFYNANYQNIRSRSNSVYEEYHLTVFIRPTHTDYHSTWVFIDPQGRYFKRHHGYRLINGRTQFKNTNRPYPLHHLFEDFERDMPYFPRNIARQMVSFTLITD